MQFDIGKPLNIKKVYVQSFGLDIPAIHQKNSNREGDWRQEQSKWLLKVGGLKHINSEKEKEMNRRHW